MKAIRREFFQKETGIAMIYLVGVGTIGGELLSIIERLNPPGMSIMGVASSKKMLVNNKPLNPGRAKTELINSPQTFDLETFLSAGNFTSNQKIFVDCTASRFIAEQYSKILGNGFSVVTANKIANTLDQAYYRSIRQIASENGLQFKYETNVGAGLPIINTLQGLLNTGDEILKIEGIMSGTLSYLFSSFDGTVPFSTLVRNARDKGFTEPDPRADLSGLDVARKILILARECGAELELENISVKSLIPEDLAGDLSVDDFLDQLTAYDEEFNTKRQQAESSGKVLRYIGTWEGRNGQVSLQAVSPENPFYRQKGRENFFIFTTRRYHNVPLVIKGHGVGPAVTAAGVLADIQACIRT